MSMFWIQIAVYHELCARMRLIRVMGTMSKFGESKDQGKTTADTGSTVHKTEAVVLPTRFMPSMKANIAMLQVIRAEPIDASHATDEI
jgi:outer membrane cobalamin receptor